MSAYIKDNFSKLVSFITMIGILFGAFQIYFNMNENIKLLKKSQESIEKQVTSLGPKITKHFEKTRCRDALTLLNLSMTYPDFVSMKDRDQAIQGMFEAGHGAQLKDLELTCNSCDRHILEQFISKRAADHHCPRFGIALAKSKKDAKQIKILERLSSELRATL